MLGAHIVHEQSVGGRSSDQRQDKRIRAVFFQRFSRDFQRQCEHEGVLIHCFFQKLYGGNRIL